jgi:hypothetical protein
MPDFLNDRYGGDPIDEFQNAGSLRVSGQTTICTLTVLGPG